jgi:hypothetical protein
VFLSQKSPLFELHFDLIQKMCLIWPVVWFLFGAIEGCFRSLFGVMEG